MKAYICSSTYCASASGYPLSSSYKATFKECDPIIILSSVLLMNIFGISAAIYSFLLYVIVNVFNALIFNILSAVCLLMVNVNDLKCTMFQEKYIHAQNRDDCDICF